MRSSISVASLVLTVERTRVEMGDPPPWSWWAACGRVPGRACTFLAVALRARGLFSGRDAGTAGPADRWDGAGDPHASSQLTYSSYDGVIHS